jgi:phosphatidate cytidylyltransferase
MAFLPQVKAFNWGNFGLRATSGAILAAAAVGSVWLFGPPVQLPEPFLVMIAVAGALLSIEWAAMVSPTQSWRTALMTTLSVIGVIFLAYRGWYLAAWLCVLLGAVSTAWVARGAAVRASDGAYGVLYIAPACLVLVWLVETKQGPGWTLMLFAATWAADIAAFLVGSAVKGPKLWPRFSPNKTWSGFVGGLAGAMAASVGVAAATMQLSLVGAAVIGLAGGLATMAGDLWESMLKRRFGVKDSGDIIPGHGGLLDRVDGLMFAVMVFAVARLWVQIGWAH